MSFSRVLEAAIDEYVTSLELPQRVRTLIGQARYDLFYGPVFDDPEYPGFGGAVDRIRAALDDVTDIYVETWSGCWQRCRPEPEYDEEGDLIGRAPCDFTMVDAQAVKTSLLGSELAAYV